MKNSFAFLMMVLMMAQANFAQADSGKKLQPDVVSTANLMRHGTVTKCLGDIERQLSASLTITEITKSEVEDLTAYSITGVLLQGGDIAIGYATVEVTGSYQFPWGFAYTCKVLSLPKAH